MISTVDLRIGNLVCSYSDTGDIVVVENIHADGINCSWQYDSYYPEYDCGAMYGIPLTVDWLIKLGFTKDELGAYDYGDRIGDLYNHNFISICIVDGKYYHYVHVDGGEYYSFKDTELPYIHSIQNYAYAKSGKEIILAPDWNDLPFKD